MNSTVFEKNVPCNTLPFRPHHTCSRSGGIRALLESQWSSEEGKTHKGVSDLLNPFSFRLVSGRTQWKLNCGSQFPPPIRPTFSLGWAQDIKNITLLRQRFCWIILETFPTFSSESCWCQMRYALLQVFMSTFICSKESAKNTGYRTCSEVLVCFTTVTVNISTRKCILKSQRLLTSQLFLVMLTRNFWWVDYSLLEGLLSINC